MIDLSKISDEDKRALIKPCICAMGTYQHSVTGDPTIAHGSCYTCQDRGFVLRFIGPRQHRYTPQGPWLPGYTA